MRISRCSNLRAICSLLCAISVSCLASEMPDDPEKVLDEIFAFDTMRGWESAVREDPNKFRPALKRRADEDLPALEQVKLVELGFFVFDESIFRREADEALKRLREISETDPVVTQYIERIEYLVEIRPGFGDEGTNPNVPSENVLARPDAESGIEAHSSVEPDSESTEESAQQSPSSSRSPVWPYALVAVALVGIVFVLLRSRCWGSGNNS